MDVRFSAAATLDGTGRHHGALSMLLERTRDALAVVAVPPDPTADILIVWANAELSRRVGIPVADLIGARPDFLDDRTFDATAVDRIEHAMRSGVAFDEELWVRLSHAAPYLAQVEGFPADRTPDGGMLYAVLSRDVSLRASEARLRQAIEALNDAFLLLDDEQRVVLFNRRFVEIYPELAPHLRPGIHMAEMTDLALKAGIFVDAVGREAEWRAERLRRLTDPGVPFDVQLSGGRWVRIAETRTADGWTASIRTDITAEKESERRLRESELRFRALAEASPTGIFQTDVAGGMLYANPALAKLSGLPLEELQLKGWQAAVHPDDLPSMLQVTRAGVRARRGFTYQIRLRDRWASVLGAPFRDADGHIIGFIGTVTDIHDQRMAEAALRDSEARYRKIIETAQEGLIVNDLDGITTFVNQRMAAMVGWTVEEMTGRHISAFLDAEAGAIVEEKRVRRRQGISEQYELRFRRRDGTELWTLVSSSPLTDADDRVVGSLAMVVDITDRHRADQALARHVRELEESRRQLELNAQRLEELAERYEQEKVRAEESSLAKSRFLSAMSHELRTPLNLILGFSDILRSEGGGGIADPKLRSFAEDIHEAGEYLLELINDILDMSKIEAGKYELRVGSVDVYRLIEETSRLMRQKAADNALELRLELASDLPRRILADGRAVRQVLLNLLSNAIKFTRSGGSVAVRARTVDGHLELAVRDTGIGIPAEHLPRLGRPFEQIDSALNRRHQGSGLGLALCKSLVELHGGSLSISSTPGVGTTVTVTLPLTLDR